MGLSLLAAPLAVQAQAIDSGALQRQQNPTPGQGPGQARDAAPPREEAAVQVQGEMVTASSADRTVDPGETLFVSRFSLVTPSELVSEAELNEVLAEFTGRPNSIADLDRATLHLADALKEEGYHFARVRIPQQEVTDGVVALDVAAGQLAAVKTQGLSRLSDRRAQAVVSSAMTDEGQFNLAEIERGLLLLNDLPGVRGTGLVIPGEEPGTLELSLDLREDSLTGGWLSVDNYGSRSTGQLRAAGDLRLNNPSGRGDMAELYAAVSENTRSLTLSYALPIGHSGLRARVAGSYMGYTLGDGFDDLEGEGRSRWLSAGLSYPVIRSRRMNLSVTGTAEYKKLEDRALGFNLSDRHSHAFSGGVRGNFIQGIAKRSFDYAATLTTGRLNRDGNFVDLLLDQLTRESNGGFTILRASGQWVENINTRLSLAGTVEVQFANSNLDSSEKLYLGGPRGVRAFPIEEAGSDEGQLLTLEARWFAGTLPYWGGQAWSLIGYVDGGHATRNHEPWEGWNFAQPDAQNTYWLKGLGAGARAQFGARTQFEVMVAHRIGSNPGADLTGLDADGKASKTRIWANASFSF